VPSLSDILQTARPREKSGSQTASRYDFQSNYAILRLIELHQQDQDYRLVLDLYDDVAILNSADDPTEIRLYQIKSKARGDWKTADLCHKVGQQTPRSFVSRLYQHTDVFGDSIVETAFVSNAPFIVKLLNGDMSSETTHEICGANLHSDEKVKLDTAIREDYSSANPTAWIPKFTLRRTTLGLHDQRAAVIGHLHLYVESLCSGATLRISTFYDLLHNIITQRTTHTAEGLAHEEFLREKSLTRKEFNSLLHRVTTRPRGVLADWDSISADFQNCGIGTIRQVRIKTAATSHLTNRSLGRPEARKLSASVRAWLAENSATVSAAHSFFELAMALAAAPIDHHSYTGDDFIGACLAETYEALNG